MKKIVFLAVAMMWVTVVFGQRPVGDTITCPEGLNYFTYVYDWCEDTDIDWYVETCYNHLAFQDAPYFYGMTDPNGTMSPDNTNAFYYFCGNGITGTQYITDKPIKIIGIAAPAYMEAARDTTIYGGGSFPAGSGIPGTFLNTRDTTLAGRITDSMILYQVDPDGGGLVELMAKGWRMDDPHRYIHLPPGRLGWANYYQRPIDSSLVVPLYEVMFDKPVVVEDTFVVAGTCLNNEGSYAWQFDPLTDRPKWMWLWDHCPTRYICWRGLELEETCKVWWSKFRTLDWRVRRMVVMYHGDTGIIGATFFSQIIYPIIDPGFDTTLCHNVRDIRVVARTDSSATLCWDSGDGGPWEVAFGKMTDQWEDFTITTVNTPMVTLTGLEVGTVYFALVRSYCGVTHEYGDWSSPEEVEIYEHHPEPEGIAEKEGDRMVYLMPNPARGVVSVMSSYRIGRMEVYDMTGAKVHEERVDGIAANVDVSGWRRGTYVVALYLEQGVVTKKLLVE